MSIETGGIRVVVQSEEGGELYTVWGKGTQLDIKDRVEKVEIDAVEGTIETKTGAPSRITASHGWVNQVEKSLLLDGGITITSGQHEVKIDARELRYSEQKGLIEAIGEVWVIGKGYKYGPSQRLLATPDLKRIGTEDRF